MRSASSSLADRPSATTDGRPAPPLFDLIELLFFAYRDFVEDADRLLEVYGFGRAHHRVLHFVSRRPGMTVAELLEILKITKQSLNRVMKDLVAAGLIAMRSGASDRRQRRLFVSQEGSRLAMELATVQSARLSRALHDLDGGARGQIAAFLLGVVEPANRPGVLALLRCGSARDAEGAAE